MKGKTTWKTKASLGRMIMCLVVGACFAALVSAAGAVKESVPAASHDAAPVAASGGGSLPNTEKAGGSKVYFTSDISSGGILALYRALGVPASGKVAIKLHMGEPGNQNYLRPELLRGLVTTVKGTFVDGNTRYGGRRGSTASHLAAAKEHGFTYAPVDILDADGTVKLPVRNGKQLTEALLGSRIMNYDWIISVAHFKGHSMAGYGGTFKNLAVGCATPEGKGVIHAGRWSGADTGFFERIVEYNKALMDARPGKMLYINVLNKLSVDCDCAANAPKATMPDIGVMASLDPVALEKASLDQIYARPPEERRHLVERIESRNGVHQVIYGEQMGLGKQTYELIRL
jgi:uncharacterized Fe-S center protein